ncbi:MULTISPECIES: hypothetical protein [Cryobacterium]|uniref:HTTM-like domain-containing protein n=1 Tax=Cryobacterium levicorallinum TaxID=995038 RepID=A0A1I2ZIA2_9MICO|nr:MULTISPECIES: hypothetical protein [Cryobacterium]TFB89481.1 hypothetical protein E3O11_00225 [Cryobacterium levicorallinum]TFD56679.1 hypothetical protein E3T41_16030 [Cryobacterium sp. Hh38]SFH37296.1 hypothetical protein SAMN05216274_10450 [Cryobacterium levicorallinum]
MLTIESAARITAVIVGIGILQGSLQLLFSLKEFGLSGLFDWNSKQILARSHGGSRGWMVGHSGSVWLRVVVIARIVCSIALITPFQSNLLYAAYVTIILLSSLFLAYQIRYGKDGSNQISVIILAGLAFTFLIPTSSPFQAVGLYFIAAQALLAYFAAGISKISNAQWRQGSAMQSILNTATYGHSTAAAVIRRRPWLGGFVGWSVIGVEIIFPVALVAPPGVLVAFLFAGAMLHLGTAVLIGLDIFFWAFTATFPAIIFVHGVLLGG